MKKHSVEVSRIRKACGYPNQHGIRCENDATHVARCAGRTGPLHGWLGEHCRVHADMKAQDHLDEHTRREAKR